MEYFFPCTAFPAPLRCSPPLWLISEAPTIRCSRTHCQFGEAASVCNMLNVMQHNSSGSNINAAATATATAAAATTTHCHCHASSSWWSCSELDCELESAVWKLLHVSGAEKPATCQRSRLRRRRLPVSDAIICKIRLSTVIHQSQSAVCGVCRACNPVQPLAFVQKCRSAEVLSSRESPRNA